MRKSENRPERLNFNQLNESSTLYDSTSTEAQVRYFNDFSPTIIQNINNSSSSIRPESSISSNRNSINSSVNKDERLEKGSSIQSSKYIETPQVKIDISKYTLPSKPEIRVPFPEERKVYHQKEEKDNSKLSNLVKIAKDLYQRQTAEFDFFTAIPQKDYFL